MLSPFTNAVTLSKLCFVSGDGAPGGAKYEAFRRHFGGNYERRFGGESAYEFDLMAYVATCPFAAAAAGGGAASDPRSRDAPPPTDEAAAAAAVATPDGIAVAQV